MLIDIIVIEMFQAYFFNFEAKIIFLGLYKMIPSCQQIQFGKRCTKHTK